MVFYIYAETFVLYLGMTAMSSHLKPEPLTSSEQLHEVRPNIWTEVFQVIVRIYMSAEGWLKIRPSHEVKSRWIINKPYGWRSSIKGAFGFDVNVFTVAQKHRSICFMSFLALNYRLMTQKHRNWPFKHADKLPHDEQNKWNDRKTLFIVNIYQCCKLHSHNHQTVLEDDLNAFQAEICSLPHETHFWNINEQRTGGMNRTTCYRW